MALLVAFSGLEETGPSPVFFPLHPPAHAAGESSSNGILLQRSSYARNQSP
jgi:hypothetical protein